MKKIGDFRWTPEILGNRQGKSVEICKRKHPSTVLSVLSLEFVVYRLFGAVVSNIARLRPIQTEGGPTSSFILERYSPSARFLRWKYGSSSEMRDHSGNIVAYTRTGVGQVNPWGGLFFELVYQNGYL